jgi:hypothetical protein
MADASAPSQRISASCLTTICSTNTVGVRGLAVTSPMDSTRVYNLQIADVTGMGLTLSNLNSITLAQLQESSQLITITNFGTNLLNSGEQFVVILEGSASYLPGNIATNHHYMFLNQSNLVDRELFAVVTSSVTTSNRTVLVHNYTLLNAPPTVARTVSPQLSLSLSINNLVTVYWQAVSGWSLQQNTNLAYPTPPGWTPSSGVTTSNGTSYLNLTLHPGSLFFRLSHP